MGEHDPGRIGDIRSTRIGSTVITRGAVDTRYEASDSLSLAQRIVCPGGESHRDKVLHMSVMTVRVGLSRTLRKENYMRKLDAL